MACINSYPAAQPVKTESCWFILLSPESSRKVFPQKSFAALSRDQSQNAKHGINPGAYNLVARLGASSRRGGTRPKHHSNTYVAQISTQGISAGKPDLGTAVQTLESNVSSEEKHRGVNVRVPFLSDDCPEAPNKLHTTRVSLIFFARTGLYGNEVIYSLRLAGI